jgi:hypothetical protein
MNAERPSGIFGQRLGTTCILEQATYLFGASDVKGLFQNSSMVNLPWEWLALAKETR